MFKLNPNPTFWAIAKLSVPGQEQPAEIRVEFRHKPRPELVAFFNGLEGRTDTDALLDIVAGWEGVDAPFSPEALQTLCSNYPQASAELFAAFKESFLEQRTKN